MRSPRALAILIIAAGLGPAQAQNSDGYWSAGGSGSWANVNNWDSGAIADGTDNTAFFGISLYPVTSTSAIFTLDGARTIGYINVYGPTPAANWSLTTGTGGPLTLDTTFDFPSIYVTPASLQFTINTVINGDAGLEKIGPGALVLTATNLYTGGTMASAGTLLVNGSITDTSAATVASSATLGGTGVICGPIIVQSGGIFSPGNPLGAFTLSNSLTLLAGSKTLVNVNASTLASDSVPGISIANYGGTLTVSNLAGLPAAGQSFPIFSAGAASGNFSSITPQLAGSVRWRFDPSTGVLSVVSTNLQPKFAGTALAGQQSVWMFVTNGVPGATNYLLASTNLTLPRANWPRIATNIFDAGGNLLLSNTINANAATRFYLISVP